MKHLFAVLMLAVLMPATFLPALPAAAGPLPTKVGQCTMTTIKDKETRLEDTPGSGDAVAYANGGYGVSYDSVPALHSARAGDKIKLCLTSLPSDCPPGDDRGKMYTATDLRTHKSWELPDAEHMCGGA
jgi:hypothetical protein